MKKIVYACYNPHAEQQFGTAQHLHRTRQAAERCVARSLSRQYSRQGSRNQCAAAEVGVIDRADVGADGRFRKRDLITDDE